jgi:hypothetical protein
VPAKVGCYGSWVVVVVVLCRPATALACHQPRDKKVVVQVSCVTPPFCAPTPPSPHPPLTSHQTGQSHSLLVCCNRLPTSLTPSSHLPSAICHLPLHSVVPASIILPHKFASSPSVPPEAPSQSLSSRDRAHTWRSASASAVAVER